MVNIEVSKLLENHITKEFYGVDDNSTLKLSVSLLGILEPLIVYKIEDSDSYQIISGNRRLQVAKELGIELVPVNIVPSQELNNLNSVGHNEQRKKLPSHYIKEFKEYNRIHNLRQGVRNTNSKELIETRKKLFDDIKKSSLDRLVSIDKLASEISEGNKNIYQNIMDELDNSKNIDGTRKSLLNRLKEKKNNEVVGNKYDINLLDAKIYNKSSSDMSEIDTQSASLIVTSPPYFDLRDYKNGIGQLGHEANENIFIERLVKHFEDSYRILKSDGTLWVNLGDFVVDYSYKMIPEKFAIGMMKYGWILHDKIIWLKNNPTWTGGNRSIVAHEYIYVFKKKDFVRYSFDWMHEQEIQEKSISIGLNSKKVKLRSVFDFRDGVITTNSANNSKLREYCERAGIYLTHSATFPISIPSIAIFTATEEMDLVVDPFSGTATTGRSALLFHRRYIGYELNPTYIKQSEIRLKMPTIEDLIEMGTTFDSKVSTTTHNIMQGDITIGVQTDYMKQLSKAIEDGFTVLSAFPI